MEDDEKCFEREGHKKYYVLKPKIGHEASAT
jgi:hypothetical protein